jgi:hypothetical protein
VLVGEESNEELEPVGTVDTTTPRGGAETPNCFLKTIFSGDGGGGVGGRGMETAGMSGASRGFERDDVDVVVPPGKSVRDVSVSDRFLVVMILKVPSPPSSWSLLVRPPRATALKAGMPVQFNTCPPSEAASFGADSDRLSMRLALSATSSSLPRSERPPVLARPPREPPPRRGSGTPRRSAPGALGRDVGSLPKSSNEVERENRAWILSGGSSPVDVDDDPDVAVDAVEDAARPGGKGSR